jgi:pSer/pThr/pTyr-binding forkhead associated (FHA) protein
MQGEEYGKTYDISRMLQNMNFLTVGRADKFTNNDIAIKEEQSTYISRQHCTIEKEADGSFKIRDGQRDVHSFSGWHRSTNGTFVNSAEASENGFYLREGDIISIGDAKLRLEAYGDEITMVM